MASFILKPITSFSKWLDEINFYVSAAAIFTHTHDHALIWFGIPMEILHSLPIQSFLLVSLNEFHIKDLIENFSVSPSSPLTNENQDSKQFPHVSNIDYIINLSAISVVCMSVNSPALTYIKIHKCIIKMFAALRLCNWNESEDAQHCSLYFTKQNSFSISGLCLFFLDGSYNVSLFIYFSTSTDERRFVSWFKNERCGVKAWNYTKASILCILKVIFEFHSYRTEIGVTVCVRESVFRKDLRIWLFLVNFS